MIIEIDMRDALTPTIKRALQHNAKWLRWVSKSVGYYVQKETKKGIESGSPGGADFDERLPVKARKALSRTAKRQWYGSLRKAVGYEYANGSVRIGWTSRTAARYGELQEEGYRREVTNKVRTKWAEAVERSNGELINLSPKKEEIKVPERPVFDPMAGELKPLLPGYVQKKVNSYMQENVDFGANKPVRRKYKVYT